MKKLNKVSFIWLIVIFSLIIPIISLAKPYLQTGDRDVEGAVVENISKGDMDARLEGTGKSTDELIDKVSNMNKEDGKEELNKIIEDAGLKEKYEDYEVVVVVNNGGNVFSSNPDANEYINEEYTTTANSTQKIVAGGIADGALAIYLIPKEDEEEDDDDDEPETEGPFCVYHEEIDTSHEHFNASISPDKRNLSGRAQLYSIGDIITIKSSSCIHKEKTYEKCTEHEYIVNGETVSGGVGCSKTRNESGPTSSEHQPTLTIEGFHFTNVEATDSNAEAEASVLSYDKATKDEATNTYTWQYKILNTEGSEVDKYTGNHFGKIIVDTPCCDSECGPKEFKIYFGEDIEEQTKKLTIDINQDNWGTAQVTGLIKTGEDTKLQTVGGITDLAELQAVPDNSYKIEYEANEGYIFRRIRTPEAQTLKDNNYLMPNDDVTLVIDFEEAGEYNLYVNSNVGGQAWAESSRRLSEADDSSPDFRWYEDVKAETLVQLKYKIIDEEYEFDRWEFRPYVKSEKIDENNAQFNMPSSDLTATAIFKKKSPTVEANPTLTVNSNNEYWGTAYAIVDGRQVNVSEVTPGSRCKIDFDSYTNFYFTNWVYDSKISPFVDAKTQEIIMPNYDLTITALFAPVPTEYEESIGHAVTFVAETLTPEDDIVPGTVPEMLSSVTGGASVTFGVTPNFGYRFSHWYFTKETKNGQRISIDNIYDDNGSGRFIMPDKFDVFAHAVFVENTTSTITLKIKGNGDVDFDGDIIKGPTEEGNSKDFINGEDIKLEAKPSEGWKFSHYEDKDGNILPKNEDEDEVYIHKVNEDEIIIAVFKERVAHTLYITSMVGGDAWPKNTDKYKDNYSKNKNDLGQTIHKIENIYEGEEVTISYEKKLDGYKFDKWEYKPGIEGKEETIRYSKGSTKIVMPDSDLTVTAVFYNTDTDNSPKLIVTTNNEKWGTVSAKTSKNQKIDMNEEYNATVGEEYTISHNAKSGYYFVNWCYSSTNTPFTDVENGKIKMPNSDLEIMAFFAPIPSSDDETRGHNVVFKAEPTKGGRIPQQIEEKILPGSKVSIGATPNKGYEFSHWYFKNGEKVIKVEASYDKDGSGYFIMPNEEVIAIAVFKQIGYKLYVTYTSGGEAWTYDNKDEKTILIENAIPGEKYKVEYKAEDTHKFFEWEAHAGSKSVSVKKDSEKNYYVTMPDCDLTVTAVFNLDEEKESTLRVISNNYLWGDVWLEDENGEPIKSWGSKDNGALSNNEPGIKLEAGKTYILKYKAEDGYKRNSWNPTNYFVGGTKEIGDESGSGKINITKVNNAKTDIEIVVYFGLKDDLYSLTVAVDPQGAGIVRASEAKLAYKDDFYVRLVDTAEGYEFIHWYEEVNGEKIVWSAKTYYEDLMPDRDLHLIAQFSEVDPPRPSLPIYHNISVRIDGDGEGEVEGKVKETEYHISNKGVTLNIPIIDGGTINFTADPGSKSNFSGWKVDGIVSNGLEKEIKAVHEDIEIIASFDKQENSYASDGLKIVSVRDLRWKNYFVEGSGTPFGIPSDNIAILNVDSMRAQGVTKEELEEIKMGYAVEFELVTSQVASNKAYIEITPTILDEDGVTEVPWADIKDMVADPKGRTTLKNSRFDKTIKIYGDNRTVKDGTLNITSTFQTSAKYDSSYTNNGLSINKIKWNWVYYLPAEIWFKGAGDTITVKFDINLCSEGEGSVNKQNIAKFERTYNNTKWDGMVYKYSMNKRLLDDIYDNAQN